MSAILAGRPLERGKQLLQGIAAGSALSFIKAVYPVGAVIIDKVDHRADRPGERIGPIDVLNFVGDAHDRRDVDDAQHAPDRQHDRHGYEGLARAAADRGNGVGIGQQEVEQRDGSRLARAEGNDLRSGRKNRDQLRRKSIHAHADQLRQCNGGKNAEARALFRAVVLHRAEVLAGVGGQSHGKAGDRQEGEALQLGIRAVSRHGQLAEGVDIALHDDVCQADDRVLHAGGQAVSHHLLQHLPVEAQLAPAEGIGHPFSAQMDQAEHHADGLGDRRGDCCRPYAPVKDRDEEQVERDVDEGREDQVVERTAAVAEGVHDALAGVVEHDGQHACKIVAEIGDGVRQNLRVGSHPAQDRRGKDNAEACQQNTAANADENIRVDGTGNAVVVAGAEIARNGDARAHGHAHKEADEQENQRPGGADGCQRLVAEEAADDQRICRIVKLLKNLAEQHGNCKRHDQPPWAAMRHLPGRTLHKASIPSQRNFRAAAQ